MRYFENLFLLAAPMLLTACGGGGGGGGTAPSTLAAAAVSQPRLVNFDYLGSYAGGRTERWVGLRLTACATDPLAACVDSVTLDGAPADIGELRDGHIADIHGTRLETVFDSTSSSLRGHVAIDINRTIVGNVEGIDSTYLTLRVLGQQVYVEESTYFGYPTPYDVAVGDRVAVSGHFTADGRVLATRIEPVPGAPLFLLRGILAVWPGGRQAIGNIEVNLAAAAREGFPGSAPLPGDAVLVLASRPPENGVLTVDTIRCTGECVWAQWDSGWVRGLITAWRGPRDFDVDGHAIRLRFCECSYGSPLRPGSYVDISLFEGNADVARAPSAEVSPQPEPTITLSGPIETIDPAHGALTVRGVRVQVTPATQITPVQETFFESAMSIGDLKVGDVVTVRGGLLLTTVAATSVVKGASTSDFRTTVFSLSRPALEIAGQIILTDGATVNTGCLSLDYMFGLYRPGMGGDYWLSVVLRPNTQPPVAAAVSFCPYR